MQPSGELLALDLSLVEEVDCFVLREIRPRTCTVCGILLVEEMGFAIGVMFTLSDDTIMGYYLAQAQEIVHCKTPHGIPLRYTTEELALEEGRSLIYYFTRGEDREPPSLVFLAHMKRDSVVTPCID